MIISTLSSCHLFVHVSRTIPVPPSGSQMKGFRVIRGAKCSLTHFDTALSVISVCVRKWLFFIGEQRTCPHTCVWCFIVFESSGVLHTNTQFCDFKARHTSLVNQLSVDLSWDRRQRRDKATLACVCARMIYGIKDLRGKLRRRPATWVSRCCYRALKVNGIERRWS